MAYSGKQKKKALETSVLWTKILVDWAVILGGISYVTYVAFQGNSNAAAIEHIEHDRARKLELFDEMKVDVAVIKKEVADIKDIVKDISKKQRVQRQDF